MLAPCLGGILVLGFLLPLHPPLLAAEDPLVETLLIRGTRRPLTLETGAGQRLDLERIDRDVRRLWATGWFDDIRVESSGSAQGVQLTFAVAERPRFYLRRIEFEPARERRTVRLEKGVPLDGVLARRVGGELRRQLVEDGYADAQVEAELKPAGLRQADLRLRVQRGNVYRVREVRLLGSLGLSPKEVNQALRASRPRRLLPGIGPLWHGAWLLQPRSDSRLEDDAARLRSLYFSRGYFDARVEIGAVQVMNRKATVTLEVDSGRRYGVRLLEVIGPGPAKQIPTQPSGAFSTRGLCQCLLEARREAEQRGEVDFSAQLQLKPAPLEAVASAEPTRGNRSDPHAIAHPQIDLTARVYGGPSYRVGRIEFSGHHAVSDITLRRALVLREGDLFNPAQLRRSLARLNRFAFLEPLAVSDVRAKPTPDHHVVNLKIPVKERPRGRWSLSGPLGALSLFGPPQFAIASRLPMLGQGPLELSTYYANVSLVASPWAQVGLATFARRIRWQPLAALERPYLPSQRWASGFLLSPELGWRGTLGSYGLTQAVQALYTAREHDSLRPTDLSVPGWWRAAESEGERPSVPPSGILSCQEHKSSWSWLATAGPRAAEAVAGWLPTAKLLRQVP